MSTFDCGAARASSADVRNASDVSSVELGSVNRLGGGYSILGVSCPLIVFRGVFIDDQGQKQAVIQ